MNGWLWGISASACLLGAPLLHRNLLARERPALVPPGRMVTVNGHRMHVFTEGEKRDGLTLVFLSGSGTCAPVYDFASLYRPLSREYRVAVAERAGYGYSEKAGVSRELSNVLKETRLALRLAGERPPYVLFPHSMSGLEAIVWARRYPDEVKGIVGLDMAVPEYYQNAKLPFALLSLLQAAGKLGVQRLPFVDKSVPEGLGEGERRQMKYLVHRNFFDGDMMAEGGVLLDNARKAAAAGVPEQPILLFVSNERGTGKQWLPCQKRFSSRSGGKLVQLDCGHYVHRLCPEQIVRECGLFLNTV